MAVECSFSYSRLPTPRACQLPRERESEEKKCQSEQEQRARRLDSTQILLPHKHGCEWQNL